MAEFKEEEFYNLMQAYRHAVIEDQGAVSRAYSAVKDYVTAQKTTETGQGEVLKPDPCIDRPLCSHCKGAGVEPIHDASRRVLQSAGDAVE